MADDIKWIKLTVGMFDNRKIRHLRKLPEGNNIVLIWVMLLTMAGRCNSNGFIFLTENIPYTTKMLADELEFDESVIQIALNALERFGMICRDGELLSIPGWEEHQNVEALAKIREQSRKRMVDYRARKREGVTSVGENCVYCGKPANTVDHLIPKSKGGPDKNWNLVPCCKNCNSSKRDKDLADFLNDSFVYDYQNVNHELVRSNKKIMEIVYFENGKYVQIDSLRNSYNDVTNQNKNIDIDKDIEKELEREKELDNTPPLSPSQGEREPEPDKPAKMTKKAVKEIISEFNISDYLLEYVHNWLDYKKERRFAYKERGLRILLKTICENSRKYGDEAVAKVIYQSISNGYQGITFDSIPKMANRRQSYGCSGENNINASRQSQLDYLLNSIREDEENEQNGGQKDYSVYDSDV